MIFTLYYMYATILQWWRLGLLKNKLNGTLSSQNALLVCTQNVMYNTKRIRSIENLLFHCEDRIGCTVVPRQKINLSSWLSFPKDLKCFPIYFVTKVLKIESPYIYISVQAMLDTYIKHSASVLPIEEFGELIAWRAADQFEAILKTDLDKLTKLVHCFSQSTLDINHELKLLKIESVDIEGSPAKIKVERQFSTETTQKYSCAAIHWKTFADSVKDIYSKALEVNRKPTITIENGKTEEKVVPVNQVKPIKKENKKSEERNNLDVVAADYRRHKREKSTEKHKSDHARSSGAIKKDVKQHEDESKTEKHIEEKTKKYKTTSGPISKQKAEEKEVIEEKRSKTHVPRDSRSKDKHHDKVIPDKEVHHHKDHKHSIPSHPEARSKRTTSSEKKLVKSAAITDENDADSKDKSFLRTKTKSKESSTIKCSSSTAANGAAKFSTTSNVHIVKPPNILVYADSHLAKENVKSTLASIVNRDRYIIYDLPIETQKITWDTHARLIVVCGSVPPDMTYHLLEYFVNGGQLLCLCSDLLNSVLHTFTTAEVREHELVRFSYSKWEQVKMMHHIFCYQASPAKKQFSKDSDHSNQSSNGSSPVAPRTPSTVDLFHNGKTYTIQVQVLGSEETWQTPSLLLATVKGSAGKAIFSQVHLEINPSQYEDDENKFEALRESNQARLEILRDLLTSYLEINCTNTEMPPYTPGYFLGRHELKMKLFNDCEDIRDKTITTDEVTIKFSGKDEVMDEASASFLPIHIHSCPANFSTVTYFEALNTEHIGRLVIYCDVLPSTKHIIARKLAHGLAVITRQQTNAQGRGKNTWISPMGSASFSLQLHIPLDSPLGRTLPIIQHIVMVSIIDAIKESRGCKDLDIGIKWPNDLYAEKTIKIGGVAVSTEVCSLMAIVNVGCGVNLDNNYPTASVNSVIRKTNESLKTVMKTIQPEVFYASVFNVFEKLLNAFQKGDVADFYEKYYKYWLHSNSKVGVTTEDGTCEMVKIVGIDELGYLRVKFKNGTTNRVHPDGNSFDMMKGLILPKYH